MTISRKTLIELRNQHAWSQQKLAIMAGLSERTIQRVERGGTCSPETKLALASALGVEPQELGGIDQVRKSDRTQSVKGNCLCGRVRYQADLYVDMIFHCHCSLCRRAHGSEKATQAFAKGSSLKILRGESYISRYDEGKGVRCFCKCCGSRLFNHAPKINQYLSLALACVEDNDRFQVSASCFADSKAEWAQVDDSLPRFSGYPEFDEGSSD